MLAYIFKRLLLMIPTLFGVLLMTFAVIQFVPGGPVEQMVAQLQGRDTGGEGAAAAGSGYRGRQGVDAARIEEIRQQYGFFRIYSGIDTAAGGFQGLLFRCGSKLGNTEEWGQCAQDP